MWIFWGCPSCVKTAGATACGSWTCAWATANWRYSTPARLSYPEAAGLRHLAFRVDSVAEAVAELAAKGIACEPVRMDEYSRKPFTFFRDPDGLPLELHE